MSHNSTAVRENKVQIYKQQFLKKVEYEEKRPAADFKREQIADT